MFGRGLTTWVAAAMVPPDPPAAGQCAAFEQTMAVLTALRGSDLLRVKGIIAVKECRGPVVVHAVQHVAHPPVELQDRPDADTTRVLGIVNPPRLKKIK